MFVDDYVKPSPGDKVLDLGCGPADLVSLLPDVSYTGIDSNQDYIESAKRRFGDRAQFLCADACAVDLGESAGSFDLVIASGVLHHLDDRAAERFIGVAHSALATKGRFIALDGCRVPNQSALVGWLLANDRGRFVRSRDEYECLAYTRFEEVSSDLRDDLLRIPYTHCILTCRKA